MSNEEVLLSDLIQDLPDDPYLPREDFYGPSFLDTGACICSLQPAGGPGTRLEVDDTGNLDNPISITSSADDLSQWGGSNTTAAWQCIGNQTEGVYVTTTGKWFNSLHGGNNYNLSIYDDSNGPKLDEDFIWDNKTKALVQANPSDFSIYDNACTGKNQTTFSTAFYRAYAEIQANSTPVDAAPCWHPGGALPIQIVNASSWESDGCPQGFLCANNTINSLPQYCPPITECQEARLAGTICSLNGSNIGMGPFEPFICTKGYYCPPSSNGLEQIPCPSGTYCQIGAATPTPCSIGSYCPEKSIREFFLAPTLVVIGLDLIVAIAIMFYAIRKRFAKKRETHGAWRTSGATDIKAHLAGYNELEDEMEEVEDEEMMPMHVSNHPRGVDAWTGFEAALDIPIPVAAEDAEDYEKGLSSTPQLRAFIDSMRKATDAQHFGLSFTYTDLKFHPKGVPKPILQNVTGSIDRGSLTAVMGGSGAGKSTFVNVLMGKTTNTGGSVTVNNVPGKIKRYKKLIGYVPQDDIVLPELTVYENILHSARIRLPRNWKDNDIQAHVNSVIDCLELSHVRNSLVGSVGKPVISGGQRKRVSIGVELAAAPMAIFLDEPTSGLDATSASSVMRTLKAIARLGISVIVIIHQPRMEIFEMIDDLILLGNGQIIYEGREDRVQEYFTDYGFVFPEHCNQGDVITDIITGNGRPYKRSGDISKEALIGHWSVSKQSANIKHRHESMMQVRASIFKPPPIQRSLLKQRGAPRLRQGWLDLRRAMLQQWRSRSAFFFEMALALLAGLLLGLAQNGKSGNLFKGIYNSPFEILSVAVDVQSVPELALLTAIAIGLVSGAPGVKVFSEEMLLYRRESEAGHSRIAYFLAKNISVLPRMVFACLHFSTTLLILATPIIPWGYAFFTNLLYFYCIYGLASALSMIVRREDAPLFATMISLIAGILSGAAPALSKVKTWHLEWLWRASPACWLAEIYFGQMVGPLGYLYNIAQASELTGFRLGFLWENIGVLVAIGTLYRLLAYAGLLWCGRLRI
ncbi:hypothetical protein F5Y16DRAFT_366093 [Xylariaceae sp. FL0255]|nr:hypothetical protein F5Y16DRAFT_366093 [Xylariaceae sp. FL0255]